MELPILRPRSTRHMFYLPSHQETVQFEETIGSLESHTCSVFHYGSFTYDSRVFEEFGKRFRTQRVRRRILSRRSVGVSRIYFFTNSEVDVTIIKHTQALDGVVHLFEILRTDRYAFLDFAQTRRDLSSLVSSSYCFVVLLASVLLRCIIWIVVRDDELRSTLYHVHLLLSHGIPRTSKVRRPSHLSSSVFSCSLVGGINERSCRDDIVREQSLSRSSPTWKTGLGMHACFLLAMLFNDVHCTQDRRSHTLP